MGHLAYALDALRAFGVPVERVSLVGGAAKSEAIRALAPSILGVEVVVPPDGEYVALGAAKQAAWVASGAPEPPRWELQGSVSLTGDDTPQIRERFAEAVAGLVAR